MGGHGCAHVMLWVGMGGHRSLLMGMVWVWIQTRRTMLGSDAYVAFRRVYPKLAGVFLSRSSTVVVNGEEADLG
jgi:hypothetical protein